MILKHLSILSVLTAGCLAVVLLTGCQVRQSLEVSTPASSWAGLGLSQQPDQATNESTAGAAASATAAAATQPPVSEPGAVSSAAAAGAAATEANLAAGSADLDSSPETASSSPEAAGYAPSGEDQSIESLAGDFPIIYSLNHLGEVRVTVLDREVLLTYVSPPDGQAEPDFTGISRYVSKEVDDPSGALTLVLTPASYWEMLSALQDEINQQYNQLIERGLTPASWLSLDTELDIGEIYITVDPETFAAADKYDVPAIQTLASLYQLYDGVQPDSIQVTLVFQSQEDGSVLDVMDSALEQEPETETASVAKGSVPASALVQP